MVMLNSISNSSNLRSTLRSAVRSANSNKPKYVSRTSKKSKRKIVHNVFQLCLQFCRDVCNENEVPYWVEVFDNMSRNIFPHGFKFRDSCLMSQNFSNKISVRDSSPSTCNDIIKFMKKHGVISDSDQAKALSDQNSNMYISRQVKDISRRPCERQIVFMTYACYLSEKYHKKGGKSICKLKNMAYSTIHTAYEIGLIKLNTDIVFSNGIIVDIPKLHYDDKIGFFIGDKIIDENGNEKIVTESVRNKILERMPTYTPILLPDKHNRDYKFWDVWMKHDRKAYR